MNRVRMLLVLVLPSMLVGGLVFGQLRPRRSRHRRDLGYWPAPASHATDAGDWARAGAAVPPPPPRARRRRRRSHRSRPRRRTAIAGRRAASRSRSTATGSTSTASTSMVIGSARGVREMLAEQPEHPEGRARQDRDAHGSQERSSTSASRTSRQPTSTSSATSSRRWARSSRRRWRASTRSSRSSATARQGSRQGDRKELSRTSARHEVQRSTSTHRIDDDDDDDSNNRRRDTDDDRCSAARRRHDVRSRSVDLKDFALKPAQRERSRSCATSPTRRVGHGAAPARRRLAAARDRARRSADAAMPMSSRLVDQISAQEAAIRKARSARVGPGAPRARQGSGREARDRHATQVASRAAQKWYIGPAVRAIRNEGKPTTKEITPK